MRINKSSYSPKLKFTSVYQVNSAAVIIAKCLKFRHLRSNQLPATFFLVERHLTFALLLHTILHKTFRKVTLEEASLGNGHGTKPEVQGVFGRCSQTRVDPGLGLKDPCKSLLIEDVLWFCSYRSRTPIPDPRVENSEAQLFSGKHPTRLIFLLQILSCSSRETAN